MGRVMSLSLEGRGGRGLEKPRRFGGPMECHSKFFYCQPAPATACYHPYSWVETLWQFEPKEVVLFVFEQHKMGI